LAGLAALKIRGWKFVPSFFGLAHEPEQRLDAPLPFYSGMIDRTFSPRHRWNPVLTVAAADRGWLYFGRDLSCRWCSQGCSAFCWHRFASGLKMAVCRMARSATSVLAFSAIGAVTYVCASQLPDLADSSCRVICIESLRR
jgi:hypothetical protein